MIAIDGRVALGLDEFMLRLGHLNILAQLASSISGRPRRLERDFAELLTRPVAVGEDANERIANYLGEKRLCADSRKATDSEKRRTEYRYPRLEVSSSILDGDERLQVKSVTGEPIEVWWQDYCLSSAEIESAVGAVTTGARMGSSTGVSHILDWGVILGILNRDFSGSLEAAILAGLGRGIESSDTANPFILSPEAKMVLSYLLFRADMDVFSRLVPRILEARQPIRKADGAKLFGAAVEALARDAENDPNALQRAQSIVFEQFKELKSAQRRKADEPLGSSSTAWHRASSRFESYVDLGFLTKRKGNETHRFEYVYYTTDLLHAICVSIDRHHSGIEWLEGAFIDFFGTPEVPATDRIDRDQLRKLLIPIAKLLGRPIQLFPIEALALGIAVLAPSIGVKVSIGSARLSLEELAREYPECARLSRGTVVTRPEFVSLDLERL